MYFLFEVVDYGQFYNKNYTLPGQEQRPKDTRIFEINEEYGLISMYVKQYPKGSNW